MNAKGSRQAFVRVTTRIIRANQPACSNVDVTAFCYGKGMEALALNDDVRHCQRLDHHCHSLEYQSMGGGGKKYSKKVQPGRGGEGSELVEDSTAINIGLSSGIET